MAAFKRYESTVRAGRRDKTDQVIWRDNPRAKVWHYSNKEKRNDGVFDKDGAKEIASKGNSDVINFQWTKDITAPTGHLSMHIVPRDNYLYGPHRIKPDDLLVVQADAGDGTVVRDIAYLLVDRINESAVVDGNGGERRVIVVACSDFGKVMENTCLVLDAGIEKFVRTQLQEIQAGATLQATLLKHANGNAVIPNQMVYDLFQLLMKNQVSQFKLPNSSENFSNLVKFDQMQSVMIGSFVIANLFGFDANARMWGLMKMYSNEILNELFVDIRDENTEYIQSADKLARQLIDTRFQGETFTELQTDTPENETQTGTIDASEIDRFDDTDTPARKASKLQLVHRQRPYDRASFEKLPEVVVYQTECTQLDLGLASHEVYNTFRVWGLLPGGTVLPPDRLLLRTHKESISRHGIRRYEPETMYVFPNAKVAADQSKAENGVSSSAFSTLLRVYTDILTIWNASNEDHFAGTITTRFRPDIRIGLRLKLIRSTDNSVIEGYIQSVSHNYFAGDKQQSITTISFIRGHLSKANFKSVDDPIFEDEKKSSNTTNLEGELNITIASSQTDLAIAFNKFGFVDNDGLKLLGGSSDTTTGLSDASATSSGVA